MMGSNKDSNNFEDGTKSPSTTARSIHLGFCVPIESEEQLQTTAHRSLDYANDWDGGQVGGWPVWLQPQYLPNHQVLTCRHCSSDVTTTSSTNDTCTSTTNTTQRRQPTRLRFLCQIYAPLDDTDTNSNTNDSINAAFHRSFYVFGCPSVQCAKRPTQSLVVLRSQLPRENPYYPPSDCSKAPLLPTNHPEYWKNALCVLCGCLAAGKCPVQQAYFCSGLHQKEYKRYVFDTLQQQQQQSQVSRQDSSFPSTKILLASSTTTSTTATSDEELQALLPPLLPLPSVYPMYELVVEDEPLVELDSSTPNHDHKINANTDSGDDDDDDDKINADDNNDDYDSDEDLDQTDLNRMVMGNKDKRVNASSTLSDDPITMAFYRRIQNRPNVQEQCLRYCRWPNGSAVDTTTSSPIDAGEDDNEDSIGAPLWIRSRGRVPPASSSTNGANTAATASSTDSIPPPCEYCGAPRQFEFQLLPQMLHFLYQGRESLSSNKKNSCSNNDNNFKSTAEWQGFKQALEQTKDLMERAPPEWVPPALVDAREKAIARMQQQWNVGTDDDDDDEHDENTVGTKTDIHANSDNARSNSNDALEEVDWGVVAVYTCTRSCGNGLNVNPHRPDLGAYYEEFAWKQASL